MQAIICGAGIAGLTLARWLERDSSEVVLVAREDSPRADGYMIDFFGSAFDVTGTMGLLPEPRRTNTKVVELFYVNQDEHAEGDIAYSRIAPVFAGRIPSFRRQALRHACGDLGGLTGPPETGT
ncbi:hypothetical protein [Plantactinospora sp. KLBMP9567]|uniref:hypothetical protein n=1 Tax=Plantactinospora sp. KLBMP9567 TaxID=3085900 RepID=UPI002980BF6A|nr:hypothetical protein [Plantactinospora sp. KLBMP9567]MDW5329681.1 hypothetical protein [Plantactinospora sp. KLBMP9567]